MPHSSRAAHRCWSATASQGRRCLLPFRASARRATRSNRRVSRRDGDRCFAPLTAGWSVSTPPPRTSIPKPVQIRPRCKRLGRTRHVDRRRLVGPDLVEVAARRGPEVEGLGQRRAGEARGARVAQRVRKAVRGAAVERQRPEPEVLDGSVLPPVEDALGPDLRERVGVEVSRDRLVGEDRRPGRGGVAPLSRPCAGALRRRSRAKRAVRYRSCASG